jgi:hypothetical protein
VPGKFTTRRGWADPFALMQQEDPTGELIPSVIWQGEVSASYSGACIGTPNGEPVIEGVVGFGDDFMVGNAGPVQLPEGVLLAVRKKYTDLSKTLGPVRFEWAIDDSGTVWVLQLHRGAHAVSPGVISEGTPDSWVKFDVTRGLPALREEIERMRGANTGIILQGNVGITSHFGDVLRKAQIPSYIEPAALTAGA